MKKKTFFTSLVLLIGVAALLAVTVILLHDRISVKSFSNLVLDVNRIESGRIICADGQKVLTDEELEELLSRLEQLQYYKQGSYDDVMEGNVYHAFFSYRQTDPVEIHISDAGKVYVGENCYEFAPGTDPQIISRYLAKLMKEEPTLTVGERSESTEQIAIDQIPKLILSHGEEIIDDPRIGVVSWEYTMEDGTQGALNGDGAHPLDAMDSSPFFVLDPYSEMPFEIWLGWELEPDSVLVRYWDESSWGQLDAEPVGRELLQKAASPVSKYRLVPQEGNYIYELIATWKNAPNYSGSVNYNFHTVLTDRVPSDQELYEKYISDGEKGKYYYTDVDEDGKQELFISRNKGESELVTISDGEILPILREDDLFLCEDGVIGRWGEGSGGETVVYYRIENQTPVIIDVVVCPSNELTWYHSSDPNVQLGTTKNMDRITKEEGLKICAQYVPVEDSMPGGAANFYLE